MQREMTLQSFIAGDEYQARLVAPANLQERFLNKESVSYSSAPALEVQRYETAEIDRFWHSTRDG